MNRENETGTKPRKSNSLNAEDVPFLAGEVASAPEKQMLQLKPNLHVAPEDYKTIGAR